MKIFVPNDHGATDVLKEESDCALVRPHKFEGDTYVPLWYYFQAINDTGAKLPQARVVITELSPEGYLPYWKHCVWSRDGKNWERIPDAAKDLTDTTLTIQTALSGGESFWVAVIFPMPYAWYEQLCEELATPIVEGLNWNIERRHIGDSVEGRPLYAFQVGNGRKDLKRNLLIVAGQHAVEQSGKMLAEDVLRGYHDGSFAGTVMEELLRTHNLTVVPLANPDGCYHGRMNSNARGEVLWLRTDNSVETQSVLDLIDVLKPHVMVNCHGWGNEIGELPYEDLYRFSDEDPFFQYLKESVAGCSSSGTPHILEDRVGRLEWHARERYGTHCTLVEINYHWYLPPDGSAPRQPTHKDINQRICQYLTAIAGFCMKDVNAGSSDVA